MRRQPKGDALDEYLATLGLWRKPTAKDGSCLFRAVAEQLFYTQSLHLQVREACIKYMTRNRSKFEAFIEGHFDHHLHHLRNPKEWVGQVEISALSQMYKHDFMVYQEIGKPPVNVTQNNFKDKILLCFTNGNHYDSIYPRSHVDSAAVCQSILYELLYRDVLKMDKPLDQALQMVSHKSTKPRKDSLSSTSEKADSPTPDSSPDQPDLDITTDSIEQKALPFPYRVAKALDPSIYRNIEFDSWLEVKKEQGYYWDEHCCSQLQFSPGDKCHVELEGHGDKVFNGHIQSVSPTKGPVVVFVEELGERHTVPLSSLKLLPQLYYHDSQNNRKKKKVPTAPLR